MPTKEELVDEYIKQLRNTIGNFERKVQASALLYNFFKNKGYNFYFNPKLQVDKKPDFQAQKENELDVLGEIKQSLPNPENEDYEKKYNKDAAQLKSYKKNISGLSNPHDVFLVAPQFCNEAIAYYISKFEIDSELKDKIILIKYFWSSGNSHMNFVLNKPYGSFSDINLENELKHKDYQAGENDLTDIQGYYKLFYTEDNENVPIEYVMMILWYNILPEILKSSNLDNTIQRITTGENILNFLISDLKIILDNMYTLKNSKEDQTPQFSKDILIKAMDSFVKIGKAQSLGGNKDNPRYSVNYTKITKKDLIKYLIEELNSEEFKGKAEIEINKKSNQSLLSIK